MYQLCSLFIVWNRYSKIPFLVRYARARKYDAFILPRKESTGRSLSFSSFVNSPGICICRNWVSVKFVFNKTVVGRIFLLSYFSIICCKRAGVFRAQKPDKWTALCMFAIFCCFEGKGSDTGMKHVSNESIGLWPFFQKAAFSHVSCPCSLSVISKCNSTKNCAFLLNKTAPYKISRLTKCLLINRIVESIIIF